MTVVERAEGLYDQLVAWRRHLHSHPELSFEESETSKFILSQLTQYEELDIQTKVGGGHGIIATLSSGDGPVVGVRADMDALPIEEENTHDFVSKHPGVMHACGHDAHTSMLLGAVRLLIEEHRQNRLHGTVKFIFQPAEEATDNQGLSGAPYMLDTGLLDDIEKIIALHVCPWHPVGVIQMNHGFSMANVDVFEANIYGTGGHGGYPHLSTDPLWMLSNILPTFYGIPSRRISSLDTVAASIGRVDAGSASNIIPSEVFIEGTLRSYSPQAREQLAEEVEKVFKLAETFGGSFDFKLEQGEPALNNHVEVNRALEKVIRDIYPELYIHWAPFGLGGEDFGYMTEKIPGAMFFLGCAMGDGIDRDLHTPIFDIDERCMPIGTSIFVETVKHFLNNEESPHHPFKGNSIQRGA